MDLSALRSYAATVQVEQEGVFDNCGFDLRRPLPRTLTFAANATFLAAAAASEQVSAIITTRAALDECTRSGKLPRAGLGMAISSKPRTDFFLFHNFLAERTDFYRRPFAAGLGVDCRISPSAHLDASEVRIGDRVVIGEGVTIAKGVVVGNDTVLWPGTVLGNDGFQFERVDGRPMKIAHVGGVVVGEGVEIKSNCCIDRHIFGADTIVGDHTKFDNLVYVGHCTRLGRACLVGAHASITGSVVIGDEVWIGPNATISNSITIGDRAAVSLGSVVTRDVAPGERVSGNFAIGHARFLDFIRQVR
jgi:acetyltransferase-like isoleucine patch superfamily enzyme